MSEEKEKDNSEEHKMTLQLGDIIEIRAPSNDLLNENTFFIDYINERRIVLIDVANLEQTQLNRDEHGAFTDESIQEIVLLSRSDTPGYARQNKLTTGTWIEIYIGGDVSTIITGEITSLEEDQIEIRTIPELDVIYIDFEYKGIPQDIPIKKIVIRDAPAGYKDLSEGEKEETRGEDRSEDNGEPTIEYLENGESIIHAEEDADAQEDIIHVLRTEIAKAKELVFGEDLDAVEQFVELPENQRRYGIDLQTSSLLDELLSTIPANQRNQKIMSKIHTLISRFRELRQSYSLFDENGELRQFKRNNPQMHKPLVETIENQTTKIDWIVPVSSIKKKIYVDEENKEDTGGDIESFVFDAILQEEENIKKQTYYNNRTLADESKYYKVYQQLADIMKPFENPADHPEFLSRNPVKTNLEAIVDNFDKFSSSVIEKTNIIKRQYVIQKYDLGLNKRHIVKRGDRDVIETKALTAPDQLFVRSLVVLPESVVQWSRVKLPGTNILEKADIHQFSFFLFRLLRKNKEIAPFIIEDLEKDVYEGENKDEFLSSMRHYLLSDTLLRNKEDDRFNRFLQSMVPKTRSLIHLFRKHIQGKLSFVSIVQSLEPFFIYTRDMTYKPYLEIRRILIDQIGEKKKEMDAHRRQFATLSSLEADPRTLPILKYFSERPEYVEQWIDGYQLPKKELLEKNYSTKEILEKCLAMDQGVLLGLLLQTVMSALQMPRSLTELLEPIDPMNEEEKIKAEDCHRRVLAKKYGSIADLQKDNAKETFFDKEYDQTPYDLLEKYKDQQSRMEPDVFQRFLVENLVQKHGIEEYRADDLSRIIIRKKRAVKDGDFAVVVLTPEAEIDEGTSIEDRRKMQDAAALHTKSLYYIRKSDVWVHHKDIDEEAFIDTQNLFCNVKKECMADTGTGVCHSEDEVALRMRKIAQKRIKDEFGSRFELATEDSKEALKTRLHEQLRFLQRWIRIQTVQKERANNIAYQIGLEASYGEVPSSPHQDLLNRILGQTDFIKKQHDILRLYDKYCREPMDLLSEDHGWKYCRVMNTKLLPAFLYELAKTYVEGGDYSLKLEEICHTHGFMSDNGDAYVDKHSGFTIRAIDFAEEDGYDESGFKITTHAFLQKGEVDKAVENLMGLYENKAEKQICEGERSQMICRLLEGIAGQIGHPLADIRDVALRME